MKFASVFILAILPPGALCADLKEKLERQEAAEPTGQGSTGQPMSGPQIGDEAHIRQRRWGYYAGYGMGMRGYGGMRYGMGYPMWG